MGEVKGVKVGPLCQFEPTMYDSLNTSFPELEWKYLETTELILGHVFPRLQAGLTSLQYTQAFWHILCERARKLVYSVDTPLKTIYQSGNEELLTLLSLSPETLPRVDGLNFGDMRNTYWIDGWPDWSNDLNILSDTPVSPTLLAVGATHLYGYWGLPAILRRNGWTVKHYDGFPWPQMQTPQKLSDFAAFDAHKP